MKTRLKIAAFAAALPGVALLGMLLSLGIRNGFPFVANLLSYPHFAEISSVERFQPQQVVQGSARPVKLPLESAPAHLQEALTKAQAYWDARGTYAFLVWHQGHLIHERYAPGFSAHSLSNSNSMSKPLLALAVGKAIEQGFIPNEQAPVENWITEWRGQPRGKIRIIDLLQMSSGLELDEDGLNPFSDVVRLHLSASMLPILLRADLEAPPGTKPKYLNWNSQLLTVILERATGQPYAKWLGEQIWRHLGTEPANLWADADGLPKGYCCLFARPHDWLQTGLLFLNRGKVGEKTVVSSQWLEQMLASSPLRSNYGYGVWLANVAPTDYVAKRMNEPFAAKDLYYLDGRRLQRVYVIPSRQLVIVRIGEHSFDFIEETVPNLLIRAVDAYRRSNTKNSAASL